jgi:AcrR family transcriptional regulator
MTRNAQETRSRILAAATAEFAAEGYAGARIDRIAQEARANKERVYAYYGPKHQLFETVLATRLTDAAAQTAATEPFTAGEYVTALFDFMSANPDTPRLLMWEALHYPTGPVPGEAERTIHHRRIGELLAAMPPSNGGIPHPEHLGFTLHSMVAGWFCAPHLAHMHTGADIGDTDANKRHRSHLAALADHMTQ